MVLERYCLCYDARLLSPILCVSLSSIAHCGLGCLQHTPLSSPWRGRASLACQTHATKDTLDTTNSRMLLFSSASSSAGLCRYVSASQSSTGTSLIPLPSLNVSMQHPYLLSCRGRGTRRSVVAHARTRELLLNAMHTLLPANTSMPTQACVACTRQAAAALSHMHAYQGFFSWLYSRGYFLRILLATQAWATAKNFFGRCSQICSQIENAGEPHVARSQPNEK